MTLNQPLEFLDPINYGYLDETQEHLIDNHNALDLVLLENANETFRQFVMEGKNSKFERFLRKLKCEDENSLYLRSDTVDIKEIESKWHIDDSKINDKTIEKYIKDACAKVQSKYINKQTIIYTIFGLNLGNGGHYGAFVCDLKKRQVHIFDSMSGVYNDKGYRLISGTQECFTVLADRIFNNENFLKILRTKTHKKYEFTCEPVHISYILQPTGGFDELISPILESMTDLDLQREINIQHTDSQNHFCYIWSIMFIQIYLRGKLRLFDDFLEKMRETATIPLVVVKQYILGLLNLFNKGELEHVLFFYRHFPRIWSNHKSPRSLKFHLYEFEFQSPKNMNVCLDNVLNLNCDVTRIKRTKEIKCGKKC